MSSQKIYFTGTAGKIETLLDRPPHAALRGIALIAHPHPIGGGANTNKVVHTLAKTFAQLGYLALRPNFRGVGETEGLHDNGQGETEDLFCVLRQSRQLPDILPENPPSPLPIVLAGFSFGAYCQTHLAQKLAQCGETAPKMVLVGLAAGFVADERQYDTKPVPDTALIIHGAEDTIVPLANVLDWAKPLDIPILVIPGADHFFHKKLHIIRDIILRLWEPHG